MDTKAKISNQAIKQFNKLGFSGLNLLELAQSLNISRGNLTYHFKDKEILLKTIFEDMWQQIEVERAKSRQFPSFENLHNEVQLYYKFQKKYAFIFLDSKVLQMPYINKKIRQLTKQSIADNMASIAFAIQLGNMKPEPIAGIYHNIAVNTWILSFFWQSQKIIRGNQKNEDGEKMIWTLLLPHFTAKGIQSFQKFFGKSYLKNIGPAFNSDINAFVSF